MEASFDNAFDLAILHTVLQKGLKETENLQKSRANDYRQGHLQMQLKPHLFENENALKKLTFPQQKC